MDRCVSRKSPFRGMLPAFLLLSGLPTVAVSWPSPRLDWRAIDEPGGGPEISLRAEPVQVGGSVSATLVWSVAYASRCQASGGWTGQRPLSGSASTGMLARTTTYTLSCEGPGGNALASVAVEVQGTTLRWQAPTENVDGSPLTDLAGFVIYWGPQSRGYGFSVEIADPAVTEWEPQIPSGTYFFAVTALDAEGNESAFSNEVRRIIP